jgi:hypothetical protein
MCDEINANIMETYMFKELATITMANSGDRFCYKVETIYCCNLLYLLGVLVLLLRPVDDLLMMKIQKAGVSNEI